MNYGYHEMITLMNLQDAGLFKVKDKKAPGYFDWTWSKICNQFKLINEEVNIEQPSDYSFIFNGYSPISIKIVENIIQSGGLSRIMKLLDIIGVNKDQVKTNEAQEQVLFGDQTMGGGGRPIFKKRRIMVYFVGGITYAEIAALRFL